MKSNIKEYLVTIVMPIYNAGKFLPECLESLTHQTYKKIQIIAIDDLSKDNTLKILRDFKKNHKNLQIFQNKKHYGPAICYNRALKLAQGQFIAFMNPGDKSAVNRIKRQVQFLLSHPKTVAVGTQFTNIDEKGKKLKKSELPQDHDLIYNNLLRGTSIQPETALINRLLLPKDLLYFTTNKYPLIFTEIFLKLLRYGQLANTPESLYYHRDTIRRKTRRASKLKHLTFLAQFWIKSHTLYSYRPSLRAIFTPIAKAS